MKSADTEIRLVVAKGRTERRGKDWEFGVSRSTTTFRMDKQQGPTVQHRELYPISWDKPSRKRIF